jgi:hypothetical protein
MANRPTIYQGAAAGITAKNANSFGSLGDVFALTFHHSAGPRAASLAKAQELHRSYQQQHIQQGWGDIGYHYAMDDIGRIYVLRNDLYKGAHTGGHNTGNIGFMIHGNYDYDNLTAGQKKSLRWLFRGGLLELTGHKEASFALVRGHQEWSGPTNRTACPGKNLMRHIRYLRNAEK